MRTTMAALPAVFVAFLGRAVPLSNSDRALMLLVPVAEALYAVDANRQLTMNSGRRRLSPSTGY
jgi:hypothetical protein